MKRTNKYIISILALIGAVVVSACTTPEEHTHTWGEWTTVTQVTCTEEGVQERYCECGEKEVEAIEPRGHKWERWVTVKEETCTEEGEQARCCECGEKETRTKDPLGHVWGQWKTTKEPTCAEKGERERFCGECGEQEHKEIAQLLHEAVWESNGDNATHHGACPNCGEEYAGEECVFEVKNGELLCTYCGAPSIYSGIFGFYLNIEGTGYSISRGGNFAETDLEIPETFCGKPVTTIGGFRSQVLRRVKLPETIKTIKESAFSGCKSLEKVEMNDGLIEIGIKAFYGCISLTEVKIPESVTVIGGYAFRECTSLTELKIPDSVTVIGSSAFLLCSALKKVILSGALVNLGDSVFGFCSALEEVIIPASLSDTLTEVGSSIFYGTPWHDKQPDGFIYLGRVLNECKGMLPEGTFIDNIRPDTIAISKDAFNARYGRKHTGIVGVVIPRSVKKIGMCAFVDCPNLRSVVLPNSVESVGDSVFAGCRATIYFESLTAPKGWNETYSPQSTLIYGCKLSEDGSYIESFENYIGRIEMDRVETQDPVRKGYTFGGWTTKADGTTADYTSAKVHTAPIGTKLYAIWIKKD